MRDDEALNCWDDYPMPHGCVCGNDCEPPGQCVDVWLCCGNMLSDGHEPWCERRQA